MLTIGTGGSPWSAKERTTFSGIERIHELGLTGMEVEFTHGVRMGIGTAEDLREHNKEFGVNLSVHAPYFINLNAREAKKVKESENRILDSCERANIFGAKDIVVHTGFYLKEDPKKVYSVMRREYADLVLVLGERGYKTRLCPETMGKFTQFGQLKELVSLCMDVEGLGLTYDFAHEYAKKPGTDFKGDFALMEKDLGKEFLKNLHMHFSGIEFTEKGEKKHLNLLDGAPPGFTAIAEIIKDFNVQGSMVCESPNLEKDALAMQKALNAIGVKC